MIKLKLTVKEFRALSSYLQMCIHIMREEIKSGGDIMITPIEKSTHSKIVLWDIGRRDESIMKVAHRNAQIALFEKLQLKIITSAVRSSKAHTMSIQKIEGVLILEYMSRALPMCSNNYITLVVQGVCSTVILKNLI